MDKERQEHKQFLEQQLEWCREQDRILAEIETKLHEMKELAQYRLNHELCADESERLNTQVTELKHEVQFLQEKLHIIKH